MILRPLRILSILMLVTLVGCFIDTVYDENQLDPPVMIQPRDRPIADVPVDRPEPEDDLKHPPPRPTIEDGDGMDLTFGLRDVVLDPTIFEDGGWTRFSYDLDEQITNSADTASCQASVVIPDGEQGEDNVFCSKLVEGLQTARGEDLQSYARTRMVDGDNIPMVRIEGWNGMDDDPRVTVWIGVSAQVENGEGGSTAEWDNRDVLYPNPISFTDGDITQPIVLDDNAYISGRIIVALLPDSPIYIPQGADVPPLPLQLSGGMLVAEISVDTSRLNNALLLGRWQLVRIQQALSESGVCAGSEHRVALDLLLSQFADIRANPSQDNSNPLVQCDSLSVGLGFTGYRVRLGAETRDRQRVDPPSPCG